jgi:hypothetical protein
MLVPLDEPQILVPFDSNEALTVSEAAMLAGVRPRTMREWCAKFPIARRVRGQWRVSKVALPMYPRWE